MQQIKVEPPIIYDLIAELENAATFYSQLYNRARKSHNRYGRGILHLPLNKSIALKIQQKPDKMVDLMLDETSYFCQSWGKQLKFFQQQKGGLNRAAEEVLNPLHQMVTGSQLVEKYKPRTQAAIVISVDEEFSEVFPTEVRRGFYFNLIDHYGIIDQ